MKLRFITLITLLQRLQYSPLGKTAVIYPLSFLAGLAGGMVVLGMVFFADDQLKASPPQIGLLGALWALCYVFGCLGLRPLAVRLHPRHSMLAATLLLAGSIFMIYLAPSLTWAYAGAACFGLAVSLFWPPAMGWLATGIEGVRLSRSMGWFNLCWSSGAILGQGLAGFLGDINTALPLLVAATVYLLAAFLLLGAIMTMPNLKTGSTDPIADTASAVDDKRDKFSQFRIIARVGAFAAFITTGVILTVFPIATSNDLGFSRSMVGFFMLSRALAYSVLLGVLGRLRFWHFSRRTMLIGMFSTALVCVGFVFARGLLPILIIMMFLGAMTACSYTSALFHGAAGAGDAARRSWQMAVHESVISMGVITGSTLGGLVYGKWNAPLVYAMCAALAFLGAMIQIAIIVRSTTSQLR